MPLTRLYVPRPSRFGGLVPVAQNTRMPADNRSDGVATTGVYRTLHRLACPVTAILPVYQNIDNGQISDTYTNAITLQCSVDASGLYSDPIHFPAGPALTFGAEAGALVAPDQMDIYLDDQFYLRTGVEVEAGLYWPLNVRLAVAGEGLNVDGSLALVDSGSITADTANNALAPALILGVPADGYRPVAVGLIGDSIGVGSNDDFTSGFLSRAFNSAQDDTGRPDAVVINTCLGGDGMQSYILGVMRHRWALLRHCTHIINQDGVNDLTGGASLATMQDRTLTIGRTAQALGIPIAKTTVTPAAGITGGNETTRLAYNAWLLDGMPYDSETGDATTLGADGSIVIGDAGHSHFYVPDAAAIIEADPGLLDVDLTHPTKAGHIALVACIDKTKFGLAA